MPHKSALIGSIFFVRHDAPPTVEDIREIKTRMIEAAQRTSTKFFYVGSVMATSRVPNAEERKLVNELIDEARKHCHACYMIVEGNELQHNLQRVIITGLLILTRIYNDFLTIHKSVDAAIPDLSQRMSGDCTPTIHQARAQGLVA